MVVESFPWGHVHPKVYFLIEEASVTEKPEQKNRLHADLGWQLFEGFVSGVTFLAR